MTKPNKDGWIRHRGGKCPVDEYQRIKYRMRSGVIMGTSTGALLNWEHGGWASDIMAWCPHKPDRSKIVDDLQSECEAVVSVANSLSGPIQWRDRIREIDAASKEEEARHCAAMAAYDAERTSLVAKLKAEGFLLIQSDEPNSEDESDHREEDIAQQDMSDPANWRVGDLVKSVNDEADDIRIGGAYRLYQSPSVSGRYLYLIDDDGDKRNRRIEDYEFHSRPTN